MENIGEVYHIMMGDEDNKMCFDCMKPYPTFASVNNAVFLCENCADVHAKMGSHISYIRNLKSEWDEYLLCYLRRGGNARLKTFLAEYEIVEDADFYYKYKTQAAENYRAIIRSEVLADEPPEMIQKKQGYLLSENLEINHYPEFDNYQFIGLNEHSQPKEEKTFLTRVKDVFKTFGKNVDIVVDKMKEKFIQWEVSDKIKTTSKQFVVVLKDAGGFIILKYKPVVERIKDKTVSGFETLTEKTKEGMTIIANKTKEVYSDIKSKYITKPEEKTYIDVRSLDDHSNYYELKTESQNKNIVGFIHDEFQSNLKENTYLDEIVEKDINNSFMLLNNSNISENDNKSERDKSLNISFPTLEELEKNNDK